MEKHGGSVASFAKKIDVSPPTITRWMKCESDPTRTNLIKISESLGVNLEWLATGNAVEVSVNEHKALPRSEMDTRTIHNKINELLKTIKDFDEIYIRGNTPQYTKEEQELIEHFRLCNIDRKTVILSSAKALAAQTKQEQKESEEPLKDHQVA